MLTGTGVRVTAEARARVNPAGVDVWQLPLRRPPREPPLTRGRGAAMVGPQDAKTERECWRETAAPGRLATIASRQAPRPVVMQEREQPYGAWQATGCGFEPVVGGGRAAGAAARRPAAPEN